MKTGYTDKHGNGISVGDVVRWTPSPTTTTVLGGAIYFDHRVAIIDEEPCAIFIKGSHSVTPLRWIGFNNGGDDKMKLTALEIVTIKEDSVCTQD